MKFLNNWFKVSLIGIGLFMSFALGYILCMEMHQDKVGDYLLKVNLIYLQRDALLQADKVMNNNNLWDSDDSRDMQEYIELFNQSDSLYIILNN